MDFRLDRLLDGLMGDLEALFVLVGDNDRWDLEEMWKEGSLSLGSFRACA